MSKIPSHITNPIDAHLPFLRTCKKNENTISISYLRLWEVFQIHFYTTFPSSKEYLQIYNPTAQRCTLATEDLRQVKRQLPAPPQSQECPLLQQGRQNPKSQNNFHWNGPPEIIQTSSSIRAGPIQIKSLRVLS